MILCTKLIPYLTVPARVVQICFWFRAECGVQILILIHTEVWCTRIWCDNTLLHCWDLKSNGEKERKTYEKLYAIDK